MPQQIQPRRQKLAQLLLKAGLGSFAALAAIAGLPAGVMGVYISVNTLCDMGATCCNVLGDLACSVAMKETVKLK